MRNIRSIHHSALATVLLALAAPLSALAADNLIEVTTTDDAFDDADHLCSLREAVRNANTNSQFGVEDGECPAGSGSATDVIVLPTNAVYSLTRPGATDDSGDLDIVDDPDLGNGIVDLRIEGSHANGTVSTIRQTVAGERVIDMLDAAVSISMAIVQGGQTAEGGGGINAVGGSLELTDSALMGNKAASGGGIYSTAPVRLERTLLMNNTADLLGGGMLQDGADMTMIESDFVGNDAVTGGALYLDAALLTVSGESQFLTNTASSDGGAIVNADGDLDIHDTAFIDNIAGGDGGAVHSTTDTVTSFDNVHFNVNAAVNGGALCAVGSGSVFIYKSRFEENKATSHGGAVMAGSISASRSAFVANTAALDGGAINAGLSADIYNSILADNEAGRGGAVFAQMATLLNANLADNTATTHGGAVYVFNKITMQDSRIIGNSAAGDGGGMWSESLVFRGSVIRSLVADNVALGNGGGIYSNGAQTLDLANTTISQNKTLNGQGSGLYIATGHKATMTNVTLANNSPGESLAKFGTLVMQNSIISTSGGTNCVALPAAPEIDSLGNNLSDDGTCIGLDHVTDLTDVDVLLAPLAYTSGKTMTHALLADSPAIDRGNASACEASPVDAVDQRGGTRNVGLSCDIGAHEQGAEVSMTMFGDGFE